MPAPISNSARSLGRIAPAEAPPPPAPGIFEQLGAGFRTTVDEVRDVQESRLESGYQGVTDTLTDLGVDPSTLHKAHFDPFGLNPLGGQVDRDAVWNAVSAMRRNGKAIPGVPETREEFERGLLRRNGGRDADQSVLARGGGVVGTAAQFAGGMAGSFADPFNVYTLPFGGVGKTVAGRVLSEGVLNAALEGAQTPDLIRSREAMGEDTTATDIAWNIAAAGAGGAAFRGAFEAVPAMRSRFSETVTANRARLPQGLRDRWDAHLLRKADPLDDPVLLSDVAEALIGSENLSDVERSAIVTMRRQGTAEAGNPFLPNGAGAEMHDALMSETLRAALNANPMATSRTAIAAATRETPVRPDAPSSFMQKVRGAESDGDDAAANPRSSARGRYQFTNGTWLTFYKRRYGSRGLTDLEILGKKGDANLQEALMRDLTDYNAAKLTAAGHAANEGNLYLAHFAGDEGARKLLDAAPDTPAIDVLGAKVIKANPFLEKMTARDVVAWAHRKMGSSPDAPGVRVRSDLAADDVEAGRLQAELDDALGRAANLANEQRRSLETESSALDEALDATAAPFERADLPDAAAPLEARSVDVDAPRAEVLAALPQLRDIVSSRRSLNQAEDLARDLGVSEADLRAAMGEMVREGRVTVNRKTGAYMRKPRAPDGPEDVLDFIARNGGIRDDEGHALGLRGVSARERRELHPAAIKNVERRRAGGGKRDWQRMTRRNGVLLRHEGRSIDAVGESLWEAGYLRGADSERPTTREVLEYLDQRINSGEQAYPLGEMPAPRLDALDEPDPWTVSEFDPFGFRRSPDAMASLMRERDDVRAALADLGLVDDSLDPGAVGEVMHNLGFIDPALPMAERLLRAVDMMADDAQANAFAHSQDFDYDWIDYEWPTSSRSDAGREDLAAAPDRAGREPVAGDPAQGGIRSGLLREDAGTSGEQLAQLTPAERTPFLDPDGAAIRSQADSLLHDARAAAARGAEEEAQADFAAPTSVQARTALEMQGEGRAKARVAQKPPGSEGGLFDVQAQDLTFRFDVDGDEISLRESLDGIDAETAELKNIRDCL